VRIVFHACNGGQAAAVRTGIAHSRDGLLVTLDDDLSHRPEDVPRLLERLSEAADTRALVIAAAIGRRRAFWRDTASIMANLVCNAFLKKPLPLRATTFCAFHRTLGESLIGAGSRRDAAWLAPLVQAAGRTIALPLAIDASGVKRSRYRMSTLWKLLRCRARSFLTGRLLMFAGLAAIIAIFVTAFAIRDGGQSPALVLLDGVAIVLAAAAIIVTWMMIADRRGSPLEQDPPATTFPDGDPSAGD
jgi:glycosyltransferase involved in cell wall biosynthesis